MMNEFLHTLKNGLACKCPKCHQGALYPAFFNMTPNENCPTCGFDISKNDSADGPAVLLIFVLGFLLVPLALILDHSIAPPLWVHALLWSLVAIGLTLGALKPIKSYIIYLQYKHRPQDWEEDKK